MIQYEKEKQKEKQTEVEVDVSDEEEREGSDDEELQRQLKEAQAFMKKFERAKKADKIERAVDILTSNERS